MADTIFNIAKTGLAQGNAAAADNFDWNDVAFTYRVLLFDSTSTYAPNPDHNYVSDIVGANGGVEMTGASYARKTLASLTTTKNTTNDRAEFAAANVVWTAINAGTIKAAAIYKRVGADDTTPTDDVLIAYIDSGGFPFVTNGGDFTIQWNAAGIFTIT